MWRHLERFHETGTPVKIPATYIKNLEYPDILKQVYPAMTNDGFLQFGPLPHPKPLLLRCEIVCDDGDSFVIEYIHLTCTQAGQKERGFKSLREWEVYRKSDKKPDYIPAHPSIVYRKDWQGMDDWLGLETPTKFEREFLPFQDAKAIVHKLGLKSSKEWKAHCQTRKRHVVIPPNPEVVYAHEWKGWRDWLGIATSDKSEQSLLSVLEGALLQLHDAQSLTSGQIMILMRHAGILSKRYFLHTFRRLHSDDGAQSDEVRSQIAALEAAIEEENESLQESCQRYTQDLAAALLLRRSEQMKTPRLYQLDGARFLADRHLSEKHPYGLLFVEPGMGKTLTALWALAAAHQERFIIVATLTVKKDVWTFINLQTAFPDLKEDLVATSLTSALKLPTEGPAVALLHYEELRKIDQIERLITPRSDGLLPFDAVIFDEAHSVKIRRENRSTNTGSEQRKGAELLRQGARACIGLTATPLVNDLYEGTHLKLNSRKLRDRVSTDDGGLDSKLLILCYNRDGISQSVYSRLVEHFGASRIGHVDGDTPILVREQIFSRFRDMERGSPDDLLAPLGWASRFSMQPLEQ